MTDNAARLNLLTYLPTARTNDAKSESGSDMRARPVPEGDVWRALWLVLAAHVTGLRRSDVLEDSALVAIARALDAAETANPGGGGTPWQTVGTLEERVESRVPESLSGAATLGLAREEWLATGSRLLLRDALLRVLGSVVDVAGAALVLADAHALTVMPAFVGGRPVQPTTLAHYLGGLIVPLLSACERLVGAFARLNRSPLGAGLLAGDVIAADREELAERLGFSSAVPNTMDALMGVEDVVQMVEAGISALAPIGRIVSDMLVWIRTDPTSFVLDEGWVTSPEPAQPTLVRAERLEVLQAGLATIQSELHGVAANLRATPYGPLGSAQALVFDLAGILSHDVTSILVESQAFLRDGLIVNRAYLGNRAGRGYTTAGDLAAFLMTEEQLPPSSARNIAVLVLNQLRESGLEVSGITQDMVDTAALLVIGHEIKVEIESLGRFLAPRRFLERRQVTGSPAPAMTRAWLAGERSTLDRHREWLAATIAGITSRTAALTDAIVRAAAEGDE